MPVKTIGTGRALMGARGGEIPWYLSGGIPAANCLAAYTPLGAASLAASYDNNAAPGNGLADGTYDCTLGVVPGWAAGTGWTFDGATQYLNTGLPGDTKPTTNIARANGTDFVNHRTLFGPTAPTNSWQWKVNFAVDFQQILHYGVAGIAIDNVLVPIAASHVLAVSYSGIGAYQFYMDGAPGNSGVNNVVLAAGNLSIGAVGAVPNEWWLGSIQAQALYNIVLTPVQVAAVSTAAAAL